MSFEPARSERTTALLAIAVGACLFASCGERAVPSHPPAPSRLVVALVYDQFGAAQLEKYLPYLSEDGAIKMGIRRGLFFAQAEYDYAGTYTAPGHTTIYAGAGPWKSGIVSNYLWSRSRRASLPVMDDGEHHVLGNPARFASPLMLRAPVVADQLKAATGGVAKVVSLSIKDRAAIPGGGQRPDLALWFDGSAGGFTTSTFYGPDLPEWLQSWRSAHPWEAAMEPWTPMYAKACEALLGDDAQPGEGETFGLAASFPHDPRVSKAPDTVFKMTPASTDYLLSLARQAVSELQLGRDEVPDFLAVSISAVDYAGHVFGPDSCEYMDTLIRSDAAAGKFIGELSQHTGVSVVLTSDHGVASFPERLGKGGRLFAPTFAERLQNALVPKLGQGDWIDAYASPFFYLSEAGLARRKEVVDTALPILNAMPGVYRAFDVAKVRSATGASDPVLRAVARSVFPGSGGEIFVVPEKFTTVDEMPPPDHNTSHGSPWDYDKLVPVIVWGPGIPHGKHTRRVPMNHVASTMAMLLGMTPPREAPGSGLPGVD